MLVSGALTFTRIYAAFAPTQAMQPPLAAGKKMDSTERLDALFRQAVSAIDAGDVATLELLVATHPELTQERLDSPGAWLREKVGGALDGFFQNPYLLWFVAEDPVRNGTLPRNIGQIARTIIKAAERDGARSLQEQLDYALRLVCWSWIARECGVQIELIDVLVDAGASLDGRRVYRGQCGAHGDSAIFNGNFAAAEHLLVRGAPLTLSAALCLGRWADVSALLPPDLGREAGCIRPGRPERQG